MTSPDLPPPGLQAPRGVDARYGGWSRTLVSSYPGRFATWRMEAPSGGVCYLKLARGGVHPSLRAEADRTRWARRHLPVPAIVEEGADETVEWLVTEALPGSDATKAPWASDGERVTRALARGLRRLHAAPPRDCPFGLPLDAALARVGRRVEVGAVDPDRDFHAEHAHLSADQAFRRLLDERPDDDDLVVCHGDYCPPNVLLEGWEPVGFVDLGELGVAPRWSDLAVATWSVGWNYGEEMEAVFLDEYGVEPDAERSRYYRLLYDLAS